MWDNQINKVIGIRLESSSDASLHDAAPLLVQAQLIAVRDDWRIDEFQIASGALFKQLHDDVVAVLVLWQKLKLRVLTLDRSIIFGSRALRNSCDRLPSWKTRSISFWTTRVPN